MDSPGVDRLARTRGLPYRYHPILSLVFLLILLTSSLIIPVPGVSAEDSWPMFHHDLALSGYTTSDAPDAANIAWIYDTGSEIRSSPAIVDGILYIGGLDGKLYALDAYSGAEVWTYAAGGEIYSSPAVANGKVYFLSSNGTMYALDATTGDLEWSKQIGPGPWDWSSPSVHGGNVFIASSNGTLYSLNADAGATNWSTEIGGQPNGPLAVANGKVYSGTHNFDNSLPTLVALNEADGTIEWTYEYHLHHDGVVGMINSSGVTVVDGNGDGNLEVYFGAYNWEGVSNQAVALHEADGTEKWTADIGGNSTSTPAVHGGSVFIGSDDGKLYALDAETGTQSWSYQTGDMVWSAPAVADGKVFFGSLDHQFYALDKDTGSLIWSYDTGASSRLMGSPAIADGMVFVGNENGKIYAFGTAGDTTPPALITDFNASDGEDSQSTLTWTNPDVSDLAEVVVRRKTDSYPTNHQDGNLIYENSSPSPGARISHTDTGLTNGTTYYYAVFSKDSAGNWNNQFREGKNGDTGTPIKLLQKTVGIFTRPFHYVPTVKMTVTYSRSSEINGEDIYLVSKIWVITRGFTGICRPQIFNQNGQEIWSSYLEIKPGKPYIKKYDVHLLVHGSDAFGVSVLGFDLVNTLMRGIIKAKELYVKAVDKLLPYLSLESAVGLIEKAKGLDEPLEAFNESSMFVSKSSSMQFYPESTEVQKEAAIIPKAVVEYFKKGEFMKDWINVVKDAGLEIARTAKDGILWIGEKIKDFGVEIKSLLARYFSPSEFRVYDAQGRVTGLINGKVKEEIPYSLYDKEETIVVITNVLDSYRYEVVGTEEGSYGLELTSVKDGEASTFTASDIPTSATTTHQYTVDWDSLAQGEEGVTVQIDSDGDGTFERTITADNELTQEEYLSTIPSAIAYIIAHWDMDNNEFDVGLPDTIDLDQILLAISWWANDTPVPLVNKSINLDKILKLIAFWANDTPITETTTEASKLASAASNLGTTATVSQRRISTPTVKPGDSFKVAVSIEAKEDLNGLGLDEDLPDGWEITPLENDEATFKASEAQWVWLQVRAGETKRVTYEVHVPQDEEIGVKTIEGVISSRSPNFDSKVIGEAEIEIERAEELRIDEIKNIPNPVASTDTTRFVVEGQGIKEIGVEIYDLSGRRVFSSGWVENGFAWHLQNDSGEIVANGVYLYIVTVKGFNEKVIRGEVRKLVILR